MKALTSFFKKAKETIIDTLDFYKEHWIRYVFFILLFILLSNLLLCLTAPNRIFKDFIHIEYIYENNALIDQKLYICGLSLEIWVSFFTILSLVIAGLFALFQYDKSTKKKQQEKGSEINYRFSERIVKKLSIICEILRNEQLIKENVLSLDPFSIKDFDCEELSKKFKNYNDIIIKYIDLIFSPEIDANYLKLCDEILSEDEKNKFPKKFNILISDTLNELESISMDISSTVAGSQFIYPSLHQILLDTIHILYLHICMVNKPETVMVDKYYTNLIYVFNAWNKIREKDNQKKAKIQRKIEQINKQMSKKIEKAKNKKPKRV